MDRVEAAFRWAREARRGADVRERQGEHPEGAMEVVQKKFKFGPSPCGSEEVLGAGRQALHCGAQEGRLLTLGEAQLLT